MKEKLKRLRGKKYVGAVELADEAARLVGQFVPRQERGSVTEVPDERMVRYYSTEGLISPPEGRQGSASIYGHLHLLQLLAIKRLQADHLPIKKIKEICQDKSANALEQLLGAGEAQAADRESPKNSATEYLQSLLKQSRSRPRDTPRVGPFGPTPSRAAHAPASAWARIEIEPGLELHIREDYRLADDARERQRLARRFISEIETRGTVARK
jgi:DNA-binding transcriptional MerR regulator